MDSIDIGPLIKLIQSVATTTPQGLMIKGGVVLVVIIGFFLFKRWLKKQAIKKAHNNTVQRREENQGQVTNESQTISQDAQNSEDRIDDLLND